MDPSFKIRNKNNNICDPNSLKFQIQKFGLSMRKFKVSQFQLNIGVLKKRRCSFRSKAVQSQQLVTLFQYDCNNQKW